MTWKDFPNSISGESFPEKYNYRDGDILLKYPDARIIRVLNVNEQRYNRLQDLVDSGDEVRIRMFVLKLTRDNSEETQIVDLSNTFENFKHSCPDCETESKFAPRSDPTSQNKNAPTSAICLKCGFRLSVIEVECPDCETQKYFVKQPFDTDDEYSCISCNSSIL